MAAVGSVLITHMDLQQNTSFELAESQVKPFSANEAPDPTAKLVVVHSAVLSTTVPVSPYCKTAFCVAHELDCAKCRWPVCVACTAMERLGDSRTVFAAQ